MRFRHADGTVVHLAYCTNVHAAQDLDGVIGQLAAYAEPIRNRLGVARLGVGLWLAAGVAEALAADRAAVARMRRELAHRGLEVVTLNAFPYTGFQDPVVKGKVYHPDWTRRRRLDYTVACARVLAELLPADAARGSVSTLPLAWRTPWSPACRDEARRNLMRLAGSLAEIESRTGREIRVGLEPEPGCVAERTDQVTKALAGLDLGRLGICLDACHLAVGYESPGTALAGLAAAGVPVVKTQVSCALRATSPHDERTRRSLARLDEPRFLHQTRERAGGAVMGADDLSDALGGGLPGTDEWRVHFHVPVHADDVLSLGTTRTELAATLDALFGGPVARTDHAEVETYTWPVLPDAAGPAAVIEGIAAELAWTHGRLVGLGLKEIE